MHSGTAPIRFGEVRRQGNNVLGVLWKGRTKKRKSIPAEKWIHESVCTSELVHGVCDQRMMDVVRFLLCQRDW